MATKEAYRKMVIVNCKGCNKEFEAPSHGKNTIKYCSHSCYANKNKKGSMLNCITCGKEYYLRQSVAKNSKYCSTECQKTGVYKTCNYCSKEYYVCKSEANRSKYCSQDCKDKYIQEHKPLVKPKYKRSFGKVVVLCEICGKESYTNPSRANRKKYCSTECMYKGVPLKNKGKKRSEKTLIELRSRRATPETLLKMRLSHLGKPSPNKGKFRGEKSPVWKGGKTKTIALCRRLSEYKKWRIDVFSRDKYTCQECGIKRGKLNAHHIKSFSLIYHENNIKNISEAIDCKEMWDINNGITLCEKCHWIVDPHRGHSVKRMVSV